MPGVVSPNAVDLSNRGCPRIQIKNEKLKIKKSKWNFAEGVLKSHEVRNFSFSFFVFHF